jgi:hypothetical protein
VSTADGMAALRAAAAVGPYFAVEPWTPDGGWRPLADLATDAVVGERVSAARTVIAGSAGIPPGSVEPRVAASIVFLGLAARLVSPPLAAAVLAGTVPQLTGEALWWRPVRGGPWPLAATPVPGEDCGPLDEPGERDAAGKLLAGIVVELICPLLAAFAGYGQVSSQVMWGNVASGLGGAVGMLGAAHPGRADAAAGLAARMLRYGPLRGTGELVRPDPGDWRRFFVRRSCCLFYRVPGAGTCGDCVLTPEDARRQQWQSALRR